ncbi:MAG TPA: plasmid pRiA4b ORF-3 family protein [Longimicrobium sp.]|nr:plasmid pRiA4b ORF-3 family protein [Longimicrobium sp.]
MFAMPSSPPSPAPVRRGRKLKPRALDLRITIAEIEPPVWRSVRVPDAYTLHQLHRVIQLVFGWLDYHLYAFEAGGRRFEEPLEDAEYEDSTSVRLRDLPLGSGARFTYTYDFGDHWVHEIVVEEVHEAEHRPDEPWLPALLAGERAGPHEDSGGPHGYAEMVKALRNKRNAEHRGYREWVGPAYDPERFDAWHASQNLALAAAWGAI